MRLKYNTENYWYLNECAWNYNMRVRYDRFELAIDVEMY